MASTDNPKLSSKTVAAFVAAVVVLVVFTLAQFGIDFEVPPGVEAAVVTIAVGIAGYVRRERRQPTVPPRGPARDPNLRAGD